MQVVALDIGRICDDGGTVVPFLRKLGGAYDNGGLTC